jgi:tRNA(fMet)-specific endonuclease VapC
VDVNGTTLYLLDTNMVGYIVTGRSPDARRLMEETTEQYPVAISAITEGEIRFGLAKKHEAVRLRAVMEMFLSGIDVLAWDSNAARAYGTLRAKLSASGKTLSSLDMLIAAQAIAADAILVTRDAALLQVDASRHFVNWATDL